LTRPSVDGLQFRTRRTQGIMPVIDWHSAPPANQVTHSGVTVPPYQGRGRPPSQIRSTLPNAARTGFQYTACGRLSRFWQAAIPRGIHEKPRSSPSAVLPKPPGKYTFMSHAPSSLKASKPAAAGLPSAALLKRVRYSNTLMVFCRRTRSARVLNGLTFKLHFNCF